MTAHSTSQRLLMPHAMSTTKCQQPGGEIAPWPPALMTASEPFFTVEGEATGSHEVSPLSSRVIMFETGSHYGFQTG